ncbi:MAG: amino acid permease [Syntrophus sp. (in: bacteria)]|nr:amino acid permease [Syntrophus sp. (in: bacteria)]
MGDTTAAPRRTLSVIDAVALIIGVVIGTGIFKTPSLVAANTGDNVIFFLAWLLGGAISLIGALCYAELATTYPHTGGDYHYLARAFGRKVAFLFGWARMTVIQPGSIAMLAFVFGDYCSQLLPSVYTTSLGAILAVMSMTTLNLMGTQKGAWMQSLLTAAKIIGLIFVLIAGAAMAPPLSPSGGSLANANPSFGLAMVFVLLTFGGWNEAVYLSAELREGKHSMVRALLWGLGAITAIYLLAGFSYLKGLGMDGMSRSEVVAADLMRKVLGEGGANFVSLLIAVSALGAINATIFTGARSNYAVGRDFSLFNFLGRWQERANTPVNALLLQGGIASALVLMGTITRGGFVTMVEFTAPIFWLFFFLAGVSLVVLRIRDPDTPRPFKIPLYPLIPVVFCSTCLYMLQASLAYTGIGALAGVGVLFMGAVLAILPRMRQNK